MDKSEGINRILKTHYRYSAYTKYNVNTVIKLINH